MSKLRELKLDYEKIKIEGRFKVKVGEEVVAEGKNKWTRFLPSSLVQIAILAQGAMLYGNGITGLAQGVTARAGTDVSTTTTPDMTDLVSKLDYAPDTISRILERGLGYSTYTTEMKFIWNPGTIPASTIGELGVYLSLSDDSWESLIENPNPDDKLPTATYIICCVWNPDLRLAVRVSSADGDFEPIDYSSFEPLILEWYVTIKF